VITAQLEDFTPRERFAELLLGVLALSRRVATVAELPRAGGVEPTRDVRADFLADFFLGALSIGRTLSGIVSCDAAATPPAPRPDVSASAPPRLEWLR
jgi:hypothetical protein